MTTHGLRATMILLLITAGYSDAAIVLRSGHRGNNSSQSYHNLRGENGRAQLIAVFNGEFKNRRSISHQQQKVEKIF